MKFESQTDPRALLQEIARDDETAFRRLFDSYYQKLFHIALYFLKSKELAEEAIADVFYILWKKRKDLPRINDLESYLYISVKNQSLQYLKRAPFLRDESADLYKIEWLPDATTPEIRLLNREYAKLVQEAINSLPAKCKEVFRLAFSDKLKHKEISRLLDISEKTVQAHIAKAYHQIARYINKKYDDKNRTGRMLSVFF